MFLHLRTWTRQHPLGLVAQLCTLALLNILLLTACGNSSSSSSQGKVLVLYAGSLVNLLEKKVGPVFQQATGYTYEGEGKGSVALANEIKGKLRVPDVFISADPAVDTSLMGPDNGNYVSWYATFTRTSMVIGYTAKSKFAADFQAAANGSKPWYQVLKEPGIHLGRTDPQLDPKGLRTLYTMQLAEQYYNQPGLTQQILGDPENTSQIFPEEELAARLSSGQLDAGFFYLNEVKDLNLPFITLPTQINLSDPSMNSAYAQASYTNPQTGKTAHGSAIVYTITIPSTTKNRAGAIAFVNFILSSQGQAFFTQDGLLQTTPSLSGDASAVPNQIKSYFQS